MSKATTECPSIHAEHDAIKKLRPLEKKKKLKKINLGVIRVSNTGIIGMSKPCIHCILSLQSAANERGYQIKDFWYSNSKGEIVETTMNNLIETAFDDPHISRYYKYTSFKIKIVKCKKARKSL